MEQDRVFGGHQNENGDAQNSGDIDHELRVGVPREVVGVDADVPQQEKQDRAVLQDQLPSLRPAPEQTVQQKVGRGGCEQGTVQPDNSVSFVIRGIFIFFIYITPF